MLSGRMRRAGWCLLAVTAAGCGDRALTVVAPPPDAGPLPDAAAVEVGPPPGSLAAAAPTGWGSRRPAPPCPIPSRR